MIRKIPICSIHRSAGVASDAPAKAIFHLLLLLLVPYSSLAETRTIVREIDAQGDQSVYVQIVDDRGQTKYVTIMDVAGNPTRYRPVYGKHGELLNISYEWGKHGERTIYRVLSNQNDGPFYKQTQGKHGEQYFIPAQQQMMEAPVKRVQPEVYRDMEDLPVRRIQPEVMGDMEDRPVRRVQPEVMGNMEDRPVRRIQPEIMGNMEDRPVRRIQPEVMGDMEDRPVRRVQPETMAEIKEFVCTLGVKPGKNDQEIKEFICRFPVQPEEAQEIIDHIVTKGADPEAAATPINEFICTFRVPPEGAEEIVDFICTKGVDRGDAKPIVDFICGLGADVQTAGQVVDEICVTKVLPAQEVSPVVATVCFGAGLPEQKTEEITKFVCGTGQINREDLGERVIEGCIMRAIPQEMAEEIADNVVSGCMPPVKLAADDYVQESIDRGLWGPSAPRHVGPPSDPGYDFGNDIPDAVTKGPVDYSQANTFVKNSQQFTPFAHMPPSSGDDGGYSIPTESLGGDNVKNEIETRTTHGAVPGDHSGRAEASTSTGEVKDPFGELAGSISNIAGTIKGANEAIDAADEIDDQIEKWGKDPSHAHTPAAGIIPGPTAMAPGPQHSPAPTQPQMLPPQGGGGTAHQKPPKPNGGKPPHINMAEPVDPPDKAKVKWAVFINHDFLGVGDTKNFMAGREQVLHPVETEDDGYKWLCPQLTIYDGGGALGSREAEFQGSTYRVRADIKSYCGGGSL